MSNDPYEITFYDNPQETSVMSLCDFQAVGGMAVSIDGLDHQIGMQIVAHGPGMQHVDLPIVVFDMHKAVAIAGMLLSTYTKVVETFDLHHDNVYEAIMALEIRRLLDALCADHPDIYHNPGDDDATE